MATRADGQPADQHERARAIAKMLFEASPKADPLPTYVPGENVDVNSMEVDSPQFWGGLVHNLNNIYMKSPASLGFARNILNPDGYGFISQDATDEYWRTMIDTFPKDSNIGKFHNNPAKFVEYAQKHALADYDTMMVWVRFFNLLGIRWTRAYNTPDTIGDLLRGIVNFYANGAGVDMKSEVAKKYTALVAQDKGREGAGEVMKPFFDWIGSNFSYSSLGQVHSANFATIFKYMLKFRDYPNVLHQFRELNNVLGIKFGPGFMTDDPARQATFIFNQMTGRLMQRENIPIVVALRRLARNPNATLPNQSTAKLVLFYFHGMCEVRDNPTSGWKQLMDNKFEDLFANLSTTRWNPRVSFWKFVLYQMLDLEISEFGSPEWAVQHYDMLVWFYSTPGLGAGNLQYFKDCYATDASPGCIATLYDMYSMFMQQMKSLTPTGRWIAGSGLAANTPRAFMLAAYQHAEKPEVRAALNRFTEFMGGKARENLVTAEEVQAYLAELARNYQNAISNL